MNLSVQTKNINFWQKIRRNDKSKENLWRKLKQVKLSSEYSKKLLKMQEH